MNQVPAEAVERDLALYPGRTPLEQPLEQMLGYLEQRLVLLDSVLIAEAE